MSNFIPSAQLDFNEVWQPTTELEFYKQTDDSDDVNVSITARVVVTASGSMVSEELTTNIAINAVYQLNAVASGAVEYDSNTYRPVAHYATSDIQQSKLTGIDKHGSFEDNKQLASNILTDWQQSRLVGTDNQSVFENSKRLQTSSKPIFEQSKLIGTSSKYLAEYQIFIAHKRTISNEGAVLIGIGSWFGFEAMLKRQTERQIAGEGADWIGRYRSYASELSKILGSRFNINTESAKGIYAASSERIIVVIPDRVDPDRPPDPDFTASTILDFRCKWLNIDTTLNFGFECQPSPPSKGVIFVTNSVSLVRSDNGREIKMLGFSVGIDSNSYTWSFSATVPLSELSKVDTAHEQRIGVDFTCNGNLWRFILDSCDDSVSFGESSLTIKGKSRAMLLAHPYATQRGFKFDTSMSARQIAEAELNRNGVASGFTLDWQLAGVNGWNVPANTYSYTGKTPINSLQWIAEAAGGFINADMSADILHVLAHYPTPSWEWAAQTPSIELPMSLITSRSRGRTNKPAYNGVTIYGENDNGIGALIKRTGTSGGYQPPMVTSDLMTDTAAAISRGKMILSDTGDIGNIGISMPLVADIGVLKPSTLIGVNDGESWVGMVRGTTITGRLSSNRALEIDQSIDVERHFDKEIV